MGTGAHNLKIIRATAGASSFEAIIASFAAKPDALITSFEDGYLPRAKAICLDLGLDESVEVVEVGTLISRLAAAARHGSKLLPKKGYVLAAIADACQQLLPGRPLDPARYLSGFHDAISNVLSGLRSWEVDADQLVKASFAVSNHLGEKLLDLSEIARSTEKTLKMLGRDYLQSRIGQLLDSSLEGVSTDGECLVIVNDYISPLEEALFDWLIVNDVNLTILEIDPPLNPHIAFPEVVRKEVGTPAPLVVSLESGQAMASEELQVEELVAADEQAECEWILRRIKGLFNQGISSREVAIVVRDRERYIPFLHAASARLEVPLQLSYRVPLLTSRLATFLLDVIEACSGADPRRLLKPLRSSYSGLTSDQLTLITHACQESFKNKTTCWQTLGEFAETEENPIPWLSPLLDWRQEATKVSSFQKDWIGRIMMLADIVPWEDQPGENAGLLIDRENRIKTSLISSLTDSATIANVIRRHQITFAQAVDWMRRVWENSDVSVSTSSFGVPVMQLAHQVPSCDHLFVLGATEGTYPRSVSENPILSDDDLIELSEALELPSPLPTSRLDEVRERRNFRRLCAAARKQLIFSYPLTQDDQATRSATYLDEVRAVVPELTITSKVRASLAPKQDECLSLADRELREALDSEREEPLLPEIEFNAIQQQMKWPEDRAFELRQLRRAADCAFRFAFQDTLEVKVQRSREAWTQLRALPDQARLVLQKTPEEARKGLQDAHADLLDRVSGRLEDWEWRLLEAGGKRIIEQWIEREFTARKKWPKRETKLDVSLQDEGVLRKLKNVLIKGTLPAVSKTDFYTVVQLYETSFPEKLETRSEGDFLYYSLLFQILLSETGSVALEIETLRENRYLLINERKGGISSAEQEGLKVISLTAGADTDLDMVSKRCNAAMKVALTRARSGEITPTPGIQCEFCDYGELCRRAKGFSEVESPFGFDTIGGRDS